MSVMDPPRPVQQQSRPKHKSGFSFRSDRNSVTPKPHKRKESLSESSAEKRKTHMSEYTKANPNAAMNEAQPGALALEKPTIQPLRGMSHKDVNGRAIVDPDLSNPTRARWERPLDTIRSFEAAIDNEWKVRHSLYRAETAPDGQGWQSQRNSINWAGNNGYDPNGPRYSNYGGYNGQPSRRDSYGEANHQPMPPRHGARQLSDPALNRYANGAGPYPNTGHQRSRDTLKSGGSSGSTSEPWREGTEPSSDNGSVERGTPTVKPTGEYNYGYPENPGQQPHPHELGNSSRNLHPYRTNGSMPVQGGSAPGGHLNQGLPAVPPKSQNLPPVPPPKRIIRLNDDGAAGSRGHLAQMPQRKSWLKRTFSRKN